MRFEPLNRDCDGVIVLVRAWEIETYVTVASASYIVPTTVAEFQFTQDIKTTNFTTVDHISIYHDSSCFNLPRSSYRGKLKLIVPW